MKYLIILLFIFSIPNILFSQGRTVNGKIINSESGKELPFANIILMEAKIGTSSDQFGNFTLKIPNEYLNDKLKISFVGFEEKIIELTKFKNGSNINLVPMVIPAQSILIKGFLSKEYFPALSMSEINKLKIKNEYSVQDIPEFLSSIPSVSHYSENGNGIGYNYISIRGFDQRRISVSINGVPQNDPEDHNIYWLDFPDIIKSTQSIYVQRGAGSGIIGYPAIGGAINIITSNFSDKPRLEFESTLGSFNTTKIGVSASSGIYDDGYSFYIKLSRIKTGGYRNSGWTDLKSFHFSAVKYDSLMTNQINIYGGFIKDGLAYTGLPKFAISDRDLRKSNFSYWEADNNGLTYAMERKPNEIENFFQPHFELLNEIKLSDNLTLNNTLFLVLGEGHFDYDASWADTSYFRLTHEHGFSPSNPSNSTIRAMVNNKQFGWLPRLLVKHNNGELILGGELRKHSSIHWGSILYGANLPNEITPEYHYYYYEGGKDIINFFVNEKYKLSNQFNIFAEGQVAYNKYRIENEKYLNNNFTISNLFFNTRLGISFKLNEEIDLYTSYANVTREPRLKNYYDAAESSGGALPQFKFTNGVFDFSEPLVKPETMSSLELGIKYSKEDISTTLNSYYMSFSNEIVSQGQIDRFGQPITGNMDKTTHYGIELALNYNPITSLQFDLSASFSKNYIKSGTTYIYYLQNDEYLQTAKLNLTDNTIAGFPDKIINASLTYNWEYFTFKYSLRYQGEMFTDNYGGNLSKYINLYPAITEYSDNRVDPFIVSNLEINSRIELPGLIEEAELILQINNLFDKLYAPYGIGKEYFPAATRNYLLTLRVNLK
ncbi:MAG: TonB-dependent receptor [Melioribacteraceae bacterium]|nr:TonB-dependent receptor [Melioribacteraceae bacterium]